jgi:anti-sigma factor ChrR (cupin superfamily)
MNCRQYQGNIADYVAGRLAPTEALQMSVHLAACPACAEAEQRERALSARFDSAPQIHAPADLWSQLAPQLHTPQPRFAWRRFFTLPRLWIATPALTVAAVVAFFLLQSPQQPKDPGGPNTTVALPKDTYPVATFVNDVRETGVRESEILLEETQAARQMGLVSAPEGGSR